MLSAIERDFIGTIQSAETSADFSLLINESVAKLYGLDAANVNSSMAKIFLFNLYSKLFDESLITIQQKSPIIHILNNISNFRLTSDERLMYFIIGEMRSCRLPEERSSLPKKTVSKKMEHVLLI